jgi:hypothetical protein
MKVAICFYGLPRLTEKCYNDIFHYFIEGNECDIYAHLWWNDSYKGKVNRLSVNEKFDQTENPIETFTRLYKPTRLEYEDCPDFETHDCLYEGWHSPNLEDSEEYDKIIGSYCCYSIYSRHLSMKKSFELIPKDKSYDLIILARSDLLLFKPGRLIDEIHNLDFNKSLYMPSTCFGGPVFAGEHPNRLGDWFHIGNYINFSKFLETSLTTITEKKLRIKTHNQERYLFFAGLANVNIEKFISSISVRRFIFEEWEFPEYRLSNFINKEDYLEAFVNKSREDINNNQILPFYTKNITTFIGEKY